MVETRIKITNGIDIDESLYRSKEELISDLKFETVEVFFCNRCKEVFEDQEDSINCCK